ncbi:MAG TPA: hypothetical protein VKZ59_03050, partial [Acidobacteriota bacterium]|nr:hypothetical protein [Acidobacteriota bacterium]
FLSTVLLGKDHYWAANHPLDNSLLATAADFCYTELSFAVQEQARRGVRRQTGENSGVAAL